MPWLTSISELRLGMNAYIIVKANSRRHFQINLQGAAGLRMFYVGLKAGLVACWQVDQTCG